MHQDITKKLTYLNFAPCYHTIIFEESSNELKIFENIIIIIKMLNKAYAVSVKLIIFRIEVMCAV